MSTDPVARTWARRLGSSEVGPDDVVVEDGLREAETVITEGLQKVRVGVTVEPVLAGDGSE